MDKDRYRRKKEELRGHLYRNLVLAQVETFLLNGITA